MALLQASGGQLQGMTLFMKGASFDPCDNGLNLGDSCTPLIPKDIPPGPCVPYTCQSNHGEDLIACQAPHLQERPVSPSTSLQMMPLAPAAATPANLSRVEGWTV